MNAGLSGNSCFKAKVSLVVSIFFIYIFLLLLSLRSLCEISYLCACESVLSDDGKGRAEAFFISLGIGFFQSFN